jgi:glycosyltransferase involved in cell wall biosynthesis
MYIIGISDALMKPAPKVLKAHILPTVYNAIELKNFPFLKDKKDYFITLARFSRDKGQHIAAELCVKNGYRLRMAGTINGIETNSRLLFELANPLSSYRSFDDFRYYSDRILPYTIKYKNITFSGNLSGAVKMKFISEARALLFPIDWEEPFGMAVIEALACGTPVIAMNRGSMSEIIEHGVNGFLANDEAEFEEYMRRIDEIDPADCRMSVENKFSAATMASEYIKRYKQAIKLNGKNV